MESQNSPAAESQDNRVSLWVLGAAAFMVASDARCVDPLLKTVAAQFNVPLGMAALAVSAYAFPYGLCQLGYGPLGDRIGKVRVMASAFSIFALGTTACAFVPEGAAGLHLLIALRFITGVFAAAVIPLSIAYIGDKFPPDKRQATLGQFMSALMLGTVFSGPMGGIFGDYLGWRKIFLWLGGLSMVVAIAYLSAARKERRPARDPNKPMQPVSVGYKLVLANPNAWTVYPAIYFEGLFLFGGFVYISSALQDNFGMKILQAGIVISFYGIGGLIYSFTAKKILREFKQWQMASMGGVMLMAGFAIGALLPTMQMWWPMIPGALMIGFGFNSLHSTLQTKATELSTKARGTAVSLFAFFFFLGQSMGVQGGGYLGTSLGVKFSLEKMFPGYTFSMRDPWLGFMMRMTPEKTIPAYWVVFATAAIGLFLTGSWVASRLPKMAQEQPVAVSAAPVVPRNAELGTASN